jgi:long-chain acyl-CoA synthetase
MVPAYSLPSAHKLPDALAQGRQLQKQAVEIAPDDLAFLQYTGGTTGVAKGAMLSHRNMMANLFQISAFLDNGFTKGEEVVVTALPLYHIFALQASCLLFVKYGCESMLITNPRDMDGLVKTLQKTRFTILPAVNTLFNGLLNHPGFAQCDFSEFKFGLGGGMAVQEAIATRWQDLTGTPLLEGYGLTECSPVVTVNPLDIPAYTGAIGVPLPHTQIKIVDDLGQIVELGSPGEICVKGPQVMQGYFQRPDATAQSIVDGWFLTGDVGRQDENGFIYIVDRKKRHDPRLRI